MQAETLTEYLEQYGQTLIEKIEESSKPLLGEFERPDVKLDREPMDAQWLRIMAVVKGWQANRKGMILSAEMGTGKAQPLSAKVLTPSGWKTMGTLVVGDELVDPDGGTCRVEAVYPQGEKEVYRVEFSDGSSTECCEEHLWLLETANDRFRGRGGRVMSLAEVMNEGVEYENGNRKWFLPQMIPFDNGKDEYPIDPYVMGLLLGDGSFGTKTSPGFTSVDREAVGAVRAEMENRFGVGVKDCGDALQYRISRERGAGRNPLRVALEQLSLDGTKSHTKFIPEVYMNSGLQGRLAILQGLIDTDGSVDGVNVEYTTTSRTMANQVAEIARSLGGACRTVSRRTGFTYKGVRKQGRRSFRVHLRLPSWVTPSRLLRKSDRSQARSKYPPARSIAKITKVGVKECQCIRVSSKRNLYLTDDYIVTHNTIMAAVACHVHAAGRPYRAVITCPTHLQKKWIREIEITIPGAKCKLISHYSDVLKMVGTKPSGAEFYVMSGNKAKLSTKWVPAFTKRLNGNGILHCPDCHADLMRTVVEDGADVQIPMRVEDLAKKPRTCEWCGGALYQWTHDVDRWPVANIIHRQGRKLFRYLVIDEAHETKNAVSAAGLSVGRMAAAIPYRIGLTGTLLNGYAESVFPTCYRLFPRKMRGTEIDWGDTMGFVRKYGRVETIISYKSQETYANRQSRGGGKTTSVRIRPGIVPSLYGDCLMENTVFCQLDELGYKLPNLAEVLHPVEMDEELGQCYGELEDDIRSAMRQMLACGSKAAISILLNTLNGWPDHPYGFKSIGYHNQDNEWVHVAEPPELDSDVVRNKEAKLVEVVKDSVRRGRQVWVYVEMTQIRDVQPRIKKLLEAEGLDVRILRASTAASTDREVWIHKNGKANVIISHPILVQTGLDLFDKGGNHNFSTLVFYQTGYRLDTLRQAAARSHRIGQWMDCEVHYLFYAMTMQEQCVRLMSQKTVAARAVEGKFSMTGFTAMTGGEESVAMLLAKNLAAGRRVPGALMVEAAMQRELRNMEAAAPRKVVVAKPSTVHQPEVCGEVSKARAKQWKKHGESILEDLKRGRNGARQRHERFCKTVDLLPHGERVAMAAAIGFENYLSEAEGFLNVCAS